MPELRDLTEIGDQIIESVVTIIVREMEATWKTVLPVELHLGARLKQAQLQTFMGPAEKVLTISFEIRLTEARGMLNFCIPGNPLDATTSQALPNKAACAEDPTPDELSVFSRTRAARYSGSYRRSDQLKAGQVLPLHHSVHAPMNAVIGDKPLFSGVPVSCCNMRGGLIQDVVAPMSRAGQAKA